MTGNRGGHDDQAPSELRACSVIAAPVEDRLHTFRVGLYLLHESNRRPSPEKLTQAEGIEKSLIEYYKVATGGRLRLTAAQPR